MTIKYACGFLTALLRAALHAAGGQEATGKLTLASLHEDDLAMHTLEKVE